LGRGRSSLHGALKVEREDHEHLQNLGYNKHDPKNVPILKNFLQYFRISELKLGNVIINLKTKKISQIYQILLPRIKKLVERR
jgi:hypothetical protein